MVLCPLTLDYNQAAQRAGKEPCRCGDGDGVDDDALDDESALNSLVVVEREGIKIGSRKIDNTLAVTYRGCDCRTVESCTKLVRVRNIDCPVRVGEIEERFRRWCAGAAQRVKLDLYGAYGLRKAESVAASAIKSITYLQLPIWCAQIVNKTDTCRLSEPPVSRGPPATCTEKRKPLVAL